MRKEKLQFGIVVVVINKLFVLLIEIELNLKDLLLVLNTIPIAALLLLNYIIIELILYKVIIHIF